MKNIYARFPKLGLAFSTLFVWSLVIHQPVLAQTVLVKDIIPGATSSNPTNLTRAGSTLYFTVNDPATGMELWKSNGTDSTTTLVKDIYPGAMSSSPSGLTAVGSTVYFRAYTASGHELWKTDGTEAGTVMVKDINPGTASSNPATLLNAGGVLYFSATNGVHGAELWKTDGTGAGTVMVKDLNPGAANGATASMIYLDGAVYFSGFNGITGGIWKTDGTAAGTTLVESLLYTPQQLTVTGSTFYFTVDNAPSSRSKQMWRSDGTAAGTIPVKEVTAPRLGPVVYMSSITRAGSAVYFVSEIYSPAFGKEIKLWKTDGTAAGTIALKSIVFYYSVPDPTIGFYNLTAKGAILYLAVNDGVNGRELWRSDGSVAGTTMVIDLNPGPASGEVSSILLAGSNLYFAANNGVLGKELWKSNGTAAGTTLVKDINPGAGSSNPDLLTAGLLGSFYFTADNGTAGRELWKHNYPFFFPFPVLPPDIIITPLVDAGARAANAEGRLGEELALNMSLFPNPVVNQLSVQMNVPASSVTATAVTDVTGRSYLHNAHQRVAQNQIRINTAGLVSGTYLLRVATSQGQQTIRFSKQ